MLIGIFFWLISKSICCLYSFELPRQVEAIQMSTSNICFKKEVHKCTVAVIWRLKKLLDCAHIGVYVVIRSNTVRKMFVSILLISWTLNELSPQLSQYFYDITSIFLWYYITKTCLYSFDSLKSHFYIVKLGFTGVYIISFISAQKHRLWVSSAVPRQL